MSDDMQLDKRRKIGGGNILTHSYYTRSLPPPSAVNNSVVPSPESSNREKSRGQQDFKSREDAKKFLTDLSSKIHDMPEDINKLKTYISWCIEKESRSDIEANMSCRTEPTSRNVEETLSKEVHDKMASQEAQIDYLRKEVCYLESKLQEEKFAHDKSLELVESKNLKLKRFEESIRMLDRNVENAIVKATAIKEKRNKEIDKLKKEVACLEGELQQAKATNLQSTESLDENEVKQRMMDEMQIYIADLQHKIYEGHKLRKQLHNTIMELKGNIRVFCRVRPLLSEIDGRRADGTVVAYPTDVENLGRGIELMQNAQNISFTFNKVFDHEASQADVFTEISQLVQSVLDGYKVCIFAYGQTGSGKTYTMMGKTEAHEEKGLIPRSVEQIFEAIQSSKSLGWKYELQASMLEIYNEEIRDLLTASRLGNNVGISGKQQFTIKHDPSGFSYVPNLTVVDIYSINEVTYLLQQASTNRSVGKTQMNEQSSRSHFVFTLRISGVNDATKQHVQGILNLIDLAGSERVAKSGSTGDCLKETQAINKSLSSLGDVIFAIANKDDHVPYRNSKLTYLLQPYLGGNSKTLMFVNISPDASSVSESICSLRFAARVNACEIGVKERTTLHYRSKLRSRSKLG